MFIDSYVYVYFPTVIWLALIIFCVLKGNQLAGDANCIQLLQGTIVIYNPIRMLRRLRMM